MKEFHSVPDSSAILIGLMHSLGGQPEADSVEHGCEEKEPGPATTEKMATGSNQQSHRRCYGRQQPSEVQPSSQPLQVTKTKRTTPDPQSEGPRRRNTDYDRTSAINLIAIL